jgi:phosphocarrier protein
MGDERPPDGWDAERLITLTNRYGLHMRPSKQVVELANTFPCDIILVSDGQEVDAKSILGLIGLGAECGTSIVLRARGERSAQAVAEIGGLLESLPELHNEPRDAVAPGSQEPPCSGQERVSRKAPNEVPQPSGRRRAKKGRTGGA